MFRLPPRCALSALYLTVGALVAPVLASSGIPPALAGGTVTRYYTVTSASDTDTGCVGANGGSEPSLRCAITDANDAGDSDGSGNTILKTIQFAIPAGSSGCTLQTIHSRSVSVCTIKPQTSLDILPALSANNATLDGYAGTPGCPSGASAPCGAQANTSTSLAGGDNAIITVAIDGSPLNPSALSGNYDGLRVFGTNDTVRGVALQDFGNGNGDAALRLAGNNTTVVGDFIGLPPNAAGTGPNGNGQGIFLDGAQQVLIGGNIATSPASMNVISGNGYSGIHFEAAGTMSSSLATANTVQGNLIGTNPAGTAAYPNGRTGVELTPNNNFNWSHDTLIGGSLAGGTANLISGNVESGVDLSGSGTTVAGNIIGAVGADTAPLGNGIGVSFSCCGNDADTTGLPVIIGGTGAGAGNVIAGNTADGIFLDSVDKVTIEGNDIGTNPSGASGLGNTGDAIELEGTTCIGIGAAVSVEASGCNIGGAGSSTRNVISSTTNDTSPAAFPGAGIVIGSSTRTVVAGNYVGTNPAGTGSLGNASDGVLIAPNGSGAPSTDNTIGGTTAANANLISGNANNGIEITGDGTTSQGNMVEGNTIGLGTSGAALGNGANGVYLHDGARGDTVGGTASGQGNTIAHNAGAGVMVGVDTTDTTTREAIRGNAISANGGLGIDLAPQGSVNCTAGAAPAPNAGVLCPTINSATTALITGHACANCTIDAFVAENASGDTGHGEGSAYVGSTIADSSGNWQLAPEPGHVYAGQYVTATATTPTSAGLPATSEFAANVLVYPATPITTGWNLIDVPLASIGSDHLSKLVMSLNAPTTSGGLGSGAISAATTYGNGRFFLYVPGYSVDVPLGPSAGIFVLSSHAGTWTPSGTLYTSGQPVTLGLGWNLVAAPYPYEGLTPLVINCEIGSVGGAITEIATYSSGGYSTWTPASGGSVTSVAAAYGMWIDVSTAPSRSWVPSATAPC